MHCDTVLLYQKFNMSPSTKAPQVVDQKFKWGKKKGIGGKQKECQFYESFTYNANNYSLYDTVFLHKEGEPEPYVGKLVKIWEQEQLKKKVKVLWFFRPVEIANFLEEGSSVENELLLASGDGKGLADINNLEAISGKCNVVCTSKDERNPQPSSEELEKADYIFYRTFDVAKCTISDKIDDKIAGVDAKFLLNRKELQHGAVKEGENQTVMTSNEVASVVKDPVPDSSGQKKETEAPMVTQEGKAKAETLKVLPGLAQCTQKTIHPDKASNGTAALKAKPIIKKDSKNQKAKFTKPSK